MKSALALFLVVIGLIVWAPLAGYRKLLEKYGWIVLLVSFSFSVHASVTQTAISASETDVFNAINGGGSCVGGTCVTLNDGDTCIIPAQIAHWFSTLVITKGITLQGGTTINTTTQTGSFVDGTTIIDDNTAGGNPNQIISATINSTSQFFHLTGITFQSGTGTQGGGLGIIIIGNAQGGTSGNGAFRVDNCHFNALNRNVQLQISGWLYGVIDHNYFQLGTFTPMAINIHHGAWSTTGTPNADGYGDGSWADTQHYGSNKFAFIENNVIYSQTSTGGVDAKQGARIVFRYNNVNGLMGVLPHGTEGDRDRGARVMECYLNNINAPNPGPACFNFRSGTGLIWNNSLSGQIHGVGNMEPYRIFQNFCAPFYGTSGLNGWDSNGGSVYTGTMGAGTTGTTIVDSGTPAWALNQWKSPDVNGSSYVVFDTTNPNTQFCSGGIVSGYSGKNYAVIIGNTSSAPYTITTYSQSPQVTFNSGDSYAIYKINGVMDQPGSGAGTLVSGANPTPIYPNNAREPVYVWGNTNTSSGGNATTVDPIDGPAIEGRDVFNQGHGNITVGTLGSRPSPPAAGKAYFATDHGPIGTLYISNGSSWSTDGDGITYQPYQYPHPLITGVSPTPTPSPLTGPPHNLRLILRRFIP